MKHNLALIGCGYWGKNYIKELENIREAKLKYVYDINKPAVEIPQHIIFTQNINDVIRDKDVKGVIIAIPTKMHSALRSSARIRSSENLAITNIRISTSSPIPNFSMRISIPRNSQYPVIIINASRSLPQNPSQIKQKINQNKYKKYHKNTRPLHKVLCQQIFIKIVYNPIIF
mgnify:CR=1 FL=1